MTADVPAGLELAGDAHQLKDLFVSLLENAAHYTPEGGAIHVSAREDGAGNVIVEVRDSGIGLSETDAAHALDRFYRGPRARRMYPAGAGLGLAIAARIAGIHGGSLELRANDGPGATAIVHLPLLT